MSYGCLFQVDRNFKGDVVLGRRSYQGVGTGSEVSMDHVQGKEAACQTMPYPRERGLQLHYLLKLGLIIIVIMLLTLCLFTSVKWMQLQTFVLALKEHNHSLTRNHSHLLLHLTDLSKNCTTLKDACERLLHVTEIDKDSNKKLSTRAKQLMVIQKGIVDVQTHFSVNEHVEAEIKAIKDGQLKGYHGQLEKENSDLRIQLQEAVKAQVKALDNQRELYKENGQLVKELADLRTKLSEGVKENDDLRTKLSQRVCAERNQHPQQASILLTNQQGTQDRLEESTGILTSLMSFLWDYLSKGVWEYAFVLTCGAASSLKFHLAFKTVTICFNFYLYLYHPILFVVGGLLLVCSMSWKDHA